MRLQFHQTVPGRISGRMDIIRGGSTVGRPIKGTGLLKKSGCGKGRFGVKLPMFADAGVGSPATDKTGRPDASGSAPSHSDTPGSALSTGRDTWRVPIHGFASPPRTSPRSSTSVRIPAQAPSGQDEPQLPKDDFFNRPEGILARANVAPDSEAGGRFLERMLSVVATCCGSRIATSWSH